jgi:hypothetical protein
MEFDMLIYFRIESIIINMDHVFKVASLSKAILELASSYILQFTFLPLFTLFFIL